MNDISRFFVVPNMTCHNSTKKMFFTSQKYHFQIFGHRNLFSKKEAQNVCSYLKKKILGNLLLNQKTSRSTSLQLPTIQRAVALCIQLPHSSVGYDYEPGIYIIYGCRSNIFVLNFLELPLKNCSKINSVALPHIPYKHRPFQGRHPQHARSTGKPMVHAGEILFFSHQNRHVFLVASMGMQQRYRYFQVNRFLSTKIRVASQDATYKIKAQ